jgi:ribose/xylose/arabinose/galactoside ABC-type transport system permease subunit
LIFGFLTNILLLKNINSNIQFVLKGAIILGAVLLQEGQIGLWWKRLRARTKKLGVPESVKNEEQKQPAG